jgi:hypothetical protein
MWWQADILALFRHQNGLRPYTGLPSYYANR